MSGGESSDGRSPRIDLVPIIDAMTCVIFFLLLSSTFVEFTKISMPQAVSSVVTTSAAKEPPLTPKLIGVVKGDFIHLVLSWSGKSPSQMEKRVKRDPNNQRSEALQATAQGVAAEFKRMFPNEPALLLGLSPQATYQEMISVMDGARQEMKDLVLVSWTEAQSAEKSAAEVKGE